MNVNGTMGGVQYDMAGGGWFGRVDLRHVKRCLEMKIERLSCGRTALQGFVWW